MDGFNEVDGVWSWVSCAAFTLICFMTLGNMLSSGIVMVAIMEYFHRGEFVTSLILSSQDFLLYLSSIFAAFLHPHLGWRGVMGLGAILSCIGRALSACAPHIYYLFVTFGVSGFGDGLMYSTGIVALSFYFERRRSLAMSISFSGVGLGLLFFGWFDGLLIPQIGWKYLLVIKAVFSLFCGVAGLSFRPIKTKEAESNQPMTGSQVKCLALFCAAFFFFGFAYTAFSSFTPRLATSRGLDFQQASLCVSLFGVSTLLTRVPIGWFADRGSNARFYSTAIFVLLDGVLLITVRIYKVFSTLAILMIIHGGLSSVWFTTYPGILLDLVTKQNVSKALPFLLTAHAFGNLFAPSVTGAIAEATQDFNLTFEILGISFLTASVLFSLTKFFNQNGKNGGGYIEMK